MRARLALVLLAALPACVEGDAGSYARRVESPNELIGGPGALGAVGDWLIGNQKIRVVIQDQGWSRGFGIFGGGILDADLVRSGVVGNSKGGTGKDNWGEFFPALFLQAFDVGEQTDIDLAAKKTVKRPGIEVIKDGSDGGEAILRTRASGGDFLAMLSKVMDIALPERGLMFETDYIVKPGARYVEIVGRLRNLSASSLDLTGQGLGKLLTQLTQTQLMLPLGDVTLFGEGNKLFAPGATESFEASKPYKRAGFDVRFAVEETYKTMPKAGVKLPALTGLVTDFLASAGADGEVSYGYAAADSDDNFAWKNRDQYQLIGQTEPTRHSILVPFLVQAFTGAYLVAAPPSLAPIGQAGDTFEYHRYFIIGNGDVASIRDELFKIRGTKVGTFEGQVLNSQGKPEKGAWVHVLDAEKRPYSQVLARDEGRFRCHLEPGTYYYVVTADGRTPATDDEAIEATAFTVGAAKSAYRLIQIPPPPELVVQVRDESGRGLPAKVTVVSSYSPAFDGKEPADFLFDYWLGEERRVTDLTWKDPPAERQRRYIESLLYSVDGEARGFVRPNRCDPTCHPYDIYVSRGPEYDLYVKKGVTLRPGERVQLDAVLHRVVDTTGYISADFHVHSRNSVDSYASLESQITSGAAEGLEIAVATDHNYVTDYRPVIDKLGLEDFIAGVTGVELSTLEMGHFNAFPLRYDTSSSSHFPLVQVCFPPEGDKVNGSAFDWVQCSPQQLFDNLRALGTFGRENTIVEVNHPRDSILGYFNQYYFDPFMAVARSPDPVNNPEAAFFIYPQNDATGQFEPDKFSYDFDALEVFNGKRFELLHSFVLPTNASDELVAQKQDYVCGNGHPDNGRGKVLLRKGGDVAYPGGVEDWLHLLNDGYTFTATGNSDSHGGTAELGNPRNYVRIADDADGAPRDGSPGAVSPLDLVDAIHQHHVIATNGPFVTMRVKTPAADGVPGCASHSDADACAKADCIWDAKIAQCRPKVLYWDIGDTVHYAQSNAGREVELEILVKSAPWVDVKRIVIYGNGEVIDELGVPEGEPGGPALDDDVLMVWKHVFDVDTVLVLEAYGDNNLFPVLAPTEEPPTNVSGALAGLLGSLADNLSFNRSDGISGPSLVAKVTPYALTNPIWLDIDANGHFDPPGNTPGPGPAPSVPCPNKALRQIPPTAVGPMIFAPRQGPQRYPRWDIRKVFFAHATHAH